MRRLITSGGAFMAAALLGALASVPAEAAIVCEHGLFWDGYRCVQTHHYTVGEVIPEGVVYKPLEESRIVTLEPAPTGLSYVTVGDQTILISGDRRVVRIITP